MAERLKLAHNPLEELIQKGIRVVFFSAAKDIDGELKARKTFGVDRNLKTLARFDQEEVIPFVEMYPPLTRAEVFRMMQDKLYADIIGLGRVLSSTLAPSARQTLEAAHPGYPKPCNFEARLRNLIAYRVLDHTLYQRNSWGLKSLSDYIDKTVIVDNEVHGDA